MNVKWVLLVFVAVIVNAGVCVGADSENESSQVAAAVEAFHSALLQGDAKAAMNVLAADAVILESGSVESRAEYERHHLAEDVRFAQSVRPVRSNIDTKIEGNAAWLTSTSRVEGLFDDKPVNASGVELMVLTKTESGWRIRAIHWSNREAKKK